MQYRTDAHLAARQSIYAYQHPRIDLPARVLDLAAPQPGMTVADVGCGNGAYLAALLRRGFTGRVVGLKGLRKVIAAAHPMGDRLRLDAGEVNPAAFSASPLTRDVWCAPEVRWSYAVRGTTRRRSAD